MTLLRLTLIFSVLLLAACSDDDDSISGTYKIASITNSNCNNPAENYDLNLEDDGCDTLSGIEVCESGTINFSADGNFTSTLRLNAPALGDIFSFNSTGTYVANGSNLTVCAQFCEDWTLSGDKLIFTQTNNGCESVIEMLRL